MNLQIWPPQSLDLNPLDFHVWGYMKDLVYEHKFDIYGVIIRHIVSVTTHISDKHSLLHSAVMKWARMCIKVEGTHFEHLL
jgi:hypothetical protein